MSGSAIVLNGISKAYGAQQVLQNFSATVTRGEAVALMGPSGCGKTTLTRLVMGLERPDAGQVEGADGLRFCCVFQEDRLCEAFAAAYNVALVLPKKRWPQVPAALAALGLEEAACERPSGLLSGGEKRRVALARAVEAEGDVLVLDEAFKGLGEGDRRAACRYVLGNLRGRSLLVVTHEPGEAQALGARVVAMQRPAAAGEGPAPRQGGGG